MTYSGIYFIGGASGTGKTTSAARLAAAFSVPVLDLDDLQRVSCESLGIPYFDFTAWDEATTALSADFRGWIGEH
jgi:cytidylate kinase